MVCRHCIAAVLDLLNELGLEAKGVGLGFADIVYDELSGEQLERLDAGLANLGFERIVDPARRLVEVVKRTVLAHVNSDEPCPRNLSQCIEEAAGRDYRSVSRVFSATEGRTIEKYYIAAKIEKAKELLSYGESPTEIAYRLGYSTPAFLSRQFKQETGMTPSAYTASRRRRTPLSDI